MPVLTRPPLNFGPPWTPVGEHRRRGETRELWHLDGPNQAYSDAYRAVRAPLVAAGFSWTEHGTERGVLVPCWWGGVDEADVDVPALQGAVDAAIAVAAAKRAEADAKWEARRLAEAARIAEISAPIRARLAEIVSSAPWQLGRSYAEAAELAHMIEWTRYGVDAASRWIANAEQNRIRAEERLSRPSPQQWFERAADAGVQAATLEGLQFLAGLDEDLASEQNGRGFSQVTTWSGHVLAERDALDQVSAAHGLALLHQHRSQLPPDVARRALGIEPKPTRKVRSPGGLLASA
ncbi:hypothetical protein [Methylobacterium sp. 37f]|uniref:hypothetical protein n=1 Tax=Methylobacterium sp. 37f TaxID=2817058 RepID=UPI001FFD72ED|nr:hypothetical protein [Methylobacterium sp. 37f]MCK2057220.1 hypothetical protein [Methylobacterium sp. 37f]